MKSIPFDITEYTLNAGCGAWTIALLADLHNRPSPALLDALAQRRPNLIAIAGDLIDGYAVLRLWKRDPSYPDTPYLMPDSVLQYESTTLDFLRAAVDIAPVFLSLGNHEWYLRESDYDLIEQCGVRLLDNMFVRVAGSGGAALTLGGLTSATVMSFREYYRRHPELRGYFPIKKTSSRKRRKDVSDLLDYGFLERFARIDGTKILLCHHPEYWCCQAPMLCRIPQSIVLAGHAHGGQWRVGRQGVFAPGQGVFPHYTAGVHRYKSSTLVISRGLANTARVPRIHNRPELVIVRLQ